MPDEAIAVEAVAEVIAEPAPKPRKKPLTPSEKLLADVESLGLVPTEEEKAEIAKVADDEMARLFVEARLDTCFDPKGLKERSIYFDKVFKRYSLAPIVNAMHLYTIGGSQRIIEDTRNLRSGKDQDGKDLEEKPTNELRLLTLKLESYTQTELSKMIVRAAKSLPQVQGPPEADKPPNKAPDSLAQPPVMIQTNGGTVHLHGVQPK